MNPLALGVTAIFALIGVAMIVKPLLSQVTALAPGEERTAAELESMYQTVLDTIHSLDEDYNTGKLAASAYKKERAYWVERGVQLLAALDAKPDVELQSEKPDIVSDSELDDAIEQALKAYRSAKGSA
jgi:hypothetical protein